METAAHYESWFFYAPTSTLSNSIRDLADGGSSAAEEDQDMGTIQNSNRPFAHVSME